MVCACSTMRIYDYAHYDEYGFAVGNLHEDLSDIATEAGKLMQVEAKKLFTSMHLVGDDIVDSEELERQTATFSPDAQIPLNDMANTLWEAAKHKMKWLDRFRPHKTTERSVIANLKDVEVRPQDMHIDRPCIEPFRDLPPAIVDYMQPIQLPVLREAPPPNILFNLSSDPFSFLLYTKTHKKIMSMATITATANDPFLINSTAKLVKVCVPPGHFIVIHGWLIHAGSGSEGSERHRLFLPLDFVDCEDYVEPENTTYTLLNFMPGYDTEWVVKVFPTPNKGSEDEIDLYNMDSPQ